MSLATNNFICESFFYRIWTYVQWKKNFATLLESWQIKKKTCTSAKINDTLSNVECSCEYEDRWGLSYSRANMLLRTFSHCSDNVILQFFTSYCGCHIGILQCCQWRQIWHHDNSKFSVFSPAWHKWWTPLPILPKSCLSATQRTPWWRTRWRRPWHSATHPIIYSRIEKDITVTLHKHYGVSNHW